MARVTRTIITYTTGFQKNEYHNWFDESAVLINQQLKFKVELRQALVQTNVSPENGKILQEKLKKIKVEG